MRRPSKKRLEVLRLVRNGADILSLAQAKLLRAMERDGLVSIGPPLTRRSVYDVRPYFGAIATKEGLAVLRQYGTR